MNMFYSFILTKIFSITMYPVLYYVLWISGEINAVPALSDTMCRIALGTDKFEVNVNVNDTSIGTSLTGNCPGSTYRTFKNERVGLFL